MKRNLIKGLLPVTLTAFLVAGCGTAANNASTTEATTQETTEKETSEEESSAANEAEAKEEGDEKPDDDKEGVVHMGDAGGMNQKVVLSDDQKELIDATKGKFDQLTYEDSENGVTLDYALYVPENYDESISYPLLMYIPDSSASGKSTDEVLSQYFGSDIWASDAEQAKHASFVFCPAFSETVVDDDFNTSDQIATAVKVLNKITEDYSIDTSRIYTTGQSMGCMTSLYLNGLYPDLFAASLFVSGQWDITTLKPLENAKFFYVTCSGDKKASGGQTEVMDMLDKDNIPYSFISDMDPEASDEEKNAQINEMLESNHSANFIRFDGLDHMTSFNYAYELEAVRDWLFAQSK